MSELLRSVASKQHNNSALRRPELGRPSIDPDQVDLCDSHSRCFSCRNRSALLVDDVVITQRITSAALHRAGYHCDLASNGKEAAMLAKENIYQVILMDVQLPVMNGVDATMLIRQNEKEHDRPHTIIYGLTSSCSDFDLTRYNEAGMDGCVEKGSIVSRAMHEALAVTKQNPDDFVFINSRNVQSIKRRCHFELDSLPAVFNDMEDEKEQRTQNLKTLSCSLSVENGNPTDTRSSRLQQRALLVDDLKITQKITASALERSGFACDMAPDGETAVQLACQNVYSVVLMDVQLPVLDGCEATKRIRNFERQAKRVPTIVFGLTASCSESDLKRYSESGMNGCIEKGCVVSRAMHEALAMHIQDPSQFLFIDAQNVHIGIR